jgi:hypothetical protein
MSATAQLAGRLRAFLREHDRQRAEIVAMLAACEGQVKPANLPVSTADDWQAEWVTLDRAAEFARVHRETMAARAAEHGLGFTIGRRWQVDLARVRAHQNQQPYPPIARDVPRTSTNFDELPRARAGLSGDGGLASGSGESS